METYLKEQLRVKKKEEAPEKKPRTNIPPHANLERELAAFGDSYLKELVMALAASGMDSLDVTIDDISVKMVKKRKKKPPINIGEIMGEAEIERVLKPVVSKYLGILKLNNEKKQPIVNVGDKVETGQLLAYIETMNMRNEIHATRSGVLSEIMEEDGRPVEYGQVIFLLEVE